MLRLVVAPACVFAIVCFVPRGVGADRKTPAPSRPVRLVEADWKGVQKLVAGHKGKVVVVELWTTTCAACLEKFPQFAALQKKHGKNIACISLNCDYDGVPGKPPAHYRKRVHAFLRKQSATFDNVLLNVSLLRFLEDTKLGSTPALFVYDKTGKLAKRFDNDNVLKEADEFTMKQVETLVGSLIDK